MLLKVARGELWGRSKPPLPLRASRLQKLWRRLTSCPLLSCVCVKSTCSAQGVWFYFFLFFTITAHTQTHVCFLTSNNLLKYCFLFFWVQTRFRFLLVWDVVFVLSLVCAYTCRVWSDMLRDLLRSRTEYLMAWFRNSCQNETVCSGTRFLSQNNRRNLTSSFWSKGTGVSRDTDTRWQHLHDMPCELYKLCHHSNSPPLHYPKFGGHRSTCSVVSL